MRERALSIHPNPLYTPIVAFRTVIYFPFLFSPTLQPYKKIKGGGTLLLLLWLTHQRFSIDTKWDTTKALRPAVGNARPLINVLLIMSSKKCEMATAKA